MKSNWNVLMIILLGVIVGFQYGCGSAIQAENNPPQSIEKYRPLVHFTPDSMWMNDPNGMVFFNGEYHLFYQYYPDSTVWGPMHWGHAVSTDLVHWKHLPVALYPDSLGYIFSGSAVADLNNTSGFGKEGKAALVAIFTYHDMKAEKAGKTVCQSQGIAYSNDNGRTWTKYEKNPVLKNPGTRDFRDPKVNWNKAANKWIMTLAVGDHVCFYSSPNLKEWKLESEFGKTLGAHGGVWECPDLFELPVVNSKGEKKWVLLVSINPGGPNGGSATQYFIGKFDGHTFTNENPVNRWVDQGKDDYAGVTYSNIPEKDGRCISIGWMSNWQYAQVVPTVKWRSAMTFPKEIRLIKDKDGYILTSMPVEEIQLLREQKTELIPVTISGATELKPQVFSPLYPIEISLEFANPKNQDKAQFGVELTNSKNEKLAIGYDKNKACFYIDRENAGLCDFSKDFKGVHTSPFIANEDKIRMRMIIDAASVELFAMDGKVVMTDIFFPSEEYSKINYFSKGGEARLNSGIVYKLNSVREK
ncbi:MAG: glycoside hydrolase family 32 protein [Bacteroidetes bacterium]|nr:glycoside hydrolase family 32 protein [Bacteroidota bacterium]